MDIKKEPEKYFEPDFISKIIVFLVRWRAMLLGWRLETLRQLVNAEAEGVRMLEVAMPQVADGKLRKIMEKHLEDECRHVRVFRERYEAACAELNQKPAESDVSNEPHPHISLLMVVAYFEIQELRALHVLQAYVGLFSGDDETVAVLERNLKDERFHASWTHKQMQQWIEEGKNKEVQQARMEAKIIDRRAFRMQVFAFLKVLPVLILRGILPPGANKPSPMS